MSSKIEWTEQTWEITAGCTECSPGCRECYARRWIWRFAHNPIFGDKYKGLVKKTNGKLQWTGRMVLFNGHLEQPLKQKNPTTYFIDSRSDLFHPKVPFDFIDDIYEVIENCPQHIFIVLTKRVKRALEFYTIANKFHRIPKNIHFCATICNQDEANRIIPILLQIPQVVRGLSIEPMLGPIELNDTPAGMITGPCDECGETKSNPNCESCMGIPSIDWVVVGGESGPKARPMRPDWVRSIRDQCANIPFFFKQWGKWASCSPQDPQCQVVRLDGTVGDNNIIEPYSAPMKPIGKKKAGRMLDGKIWSEYPKGAE